MRVISGLYRSRLLTAPAGLATRPTSDRLRETLFNIIAPRVAGSVFADLYAGSGANGIEAISRGATIAYFAESASPAIEAIRKNLKALGIASGYRIEARSVAAFLKAQVKEEARTRISKIDTVFLDPPYDEAKEYASTLGLLGDEAAAVLADGAIVVAEHHRKLPLEERYGSLERYRSREQGDAVLSFFRPVTQP